MMTGPKRGPVAGSLAPFADGFQAELAGSGYSEQSVSHHLQLLAHFSRWLAEEGLGVEDLTPGTIERFLAARRRQGRVRLSSLRGLAPLVGYLRGLGVLPVDETVPTAAERLGQEFRRYLLVERGLAVGSVRLYESVVCRFLGGRSEPIAEDLARLSGADINEFILRESRQRGEASARTAVCALRSLLKFLHVQGWTARSLASAVPAVPNRRRGSLPRGLASKELVLLLDSCDRTTALGTRDFAILTVLARLGLRSQEVAALELGDVDWRAGEVLIRGKGSRLEALPLPHDVGEVIADYLRRGRPRASCRQLFLRSCAPFIGLTRTAPTSVVRAACRRARITPVGAHRLRHSVASELLRRGAGLPEIGQILRHKSLLTTAIYAKVDRGALSTLALPWPGGDA